jgi:hypothetical protein
LRTEPNTRNPFETSTFAVPQPIPVETPVTTTSLVFAIAFLLDVGVRRDGRWVESAGMPTSSEIAVS